VNPFPFGNTNGIVDTIRQGLPGTCMTGAEVHSHIDEALFKRLGMPSWTITKTIEEYVKAAVRLAEKPAEREKIARQLLKTDADALLFRGDASLFCAAMEWVHGNHQRFQHEPNQVLRPPTVQKARPTRK
jgi:predicted O-linked N-acetylglucosamine transferase (SPINDLY family)